MRRRYAQKSPDSRFSEPFDTAEEAWFWFVRCQRVRAEGARLQGASGGIARPCDPDDIYRAALDLFRRGRLKASHLRTLAQHGLAERPPDPRCAMEFHAYQLWEEAIDRLTTSLKIKGIIR
jgi:hypothetical protein